MVELTETEREALGDLLDKYEEILGNAGCNDYRVADPELQKSIAEYQKQEEPHEDFQPSVWNMDFVVLAYLRKKLGV